jgi:hypothetical protein
MEIYFNEKEVLEITDSDKSSKFKIDDIEKLYVSYKNYLFFKMYSLKIKTTNGDYFSINIDRKDKSRIKSDINHFRILINWRKMLRQA